MEHNTAAGEMAVAVNHSTVAGEMAGARAAVNHSTVVAMAVARHNTVVVAMAAVKHNTAAMAVEHNKVVVVGAVASVVGRERNTEVVAVVVARVHNDATVVVVGAGGVVAAAAAETVELAELVEMHSSFVVVFRAVAAATAAVDVVLKKWFCFEDFAVACVDPVSSGSR